MRPDSFISPPEGNRLAAVGWVGGERRDCVIQLDRAYLIEGGALSVLDYSNPDLAHRLGSVWLPQGVRELRVCGTAAYVQIHGSGIIAYDASDPAQIRESYFLDEFLRGQGGQFDMHVFGGFLLAGAGRRDFEGYGLYDLANPLQPMLRAYTGDGDFLVLNGKLYCLWFKRNPDREDYAREPWLAIADLSNAPRDRAGSYQAATIPLESGLVFEPSGISCVEKGGIQMTICDPADISDGEALGFACSVVEDDRRTLRFRPIAVRGSSFAFGDPVDEGDFSDRQVLAKHLPGSYPELADVSAVCVAESKAFIRANNSSHFMVDISNPTAPSILGRVEASAVPCRFPNLIQRSAEVLVEDLPDEEKLFRRELGATSDFFFSLTRPSGADHGLPIESRLEMFSLIKPLPNGASTISGDLENAVDISVVGDYVYVAGGELGLVVLHREKQGAPSAQTSP